MNTSSIRKYLFGDMVVDFFFDLALLVGFILSLSIILISDLSNFLKGKYVEFFDQYDDPVRAREWAVITILSIAVLAALFVSYGELRQQALIRAFGK
jgi:uncharacterized BrkB/YihY/UPF0761 family membrane protein